METLLSAIERRQNVVVTSLQGLERSRFFLRTAFNLLAREPEATIYHVLNNDRLADRVYLEATLMPFGQFGPEGIKLAKLGGDNELESNPRLIVCSLSNLFKCKPQRGQAADATNLMIFDMTTVESLEGSIIEFQQQQDPNSINAHLDVITSSYGTSSIVLACNGPLDGMEHSLRCKFEVIIGDNSLSSRQPGYATIVTQVSGDMPLIFGGIDKPKSESDPQLKELLHKQVGALLETVAGSADPGPIVVFFPTYGKMVEYHNAWRQLGVWDRIGLPYGRENRGGDHFKRGLHELATRGKSIFLCSIRYHQDEDLAEMVMGLVRSVIIVGLPYPIMGDTWEARLKAKQEEHSKDSSLMSGSDFYECRALDFMNGIIKRCLVNEYRSKPCHFYLLDKELEHNRHRLTKELANL